MQPTDQGRPHSVISTSFWQGSGSTGKKASHSDRLRRHPEACPSGHQRAAEGHSEELVHREIVKPVTQPTRWVSSMVVIPNNDGSSHVCLDPKNMNWAIQ